MESDLATLPMFLANPGDHILVDQLPNKSWLDEVQCLNFISPAFMTKSEALFNPIYVRSQRNELKPWGWSPAAHKLLHPLKNTCSAKFKSSPVFDWDPDQRNFYSKKYGNTILNRLLDQFPNEVFIAQHQTAKICTLKKEIEKCLKDWGKLMIKAPWSSSGRGLQPITKTPIHEKVWEKILGIVKEQGYVMVEPYLDKQFDLAFQFNIENGNVNFLGISTFSTDKKGQYQGNYLNGLPDNLEREIQQFAAHLPSKIVEPLLSVLQNSELAKKYKGNIGVDAMVFSTIDGKLRVNPCLEINVRQNMGLLSLHLEKFIVAGKKGMFKTWYGGGKSYLEFTEAMKKKHPLNLRNSRIQSGFLSLTEARLTSQFGAYILV